MFVQNVLPYTCLILLQISMIGCSAPFDLSTPFANMSVTNAISKRGNLNEVGARNGYKNQSIDMNLLLCFVCRIINVDDSFRVHAVSVFMWVSQAQPQQINVVCACLIIAPVE